MKSFKVWVQNSIKLPVWKAKLSLFLSLSFDARLDELLNRDNQAEQLKAGQPVAHGSLSLLSIKNCFFCFWRVFLKKQFVSRPFDSNFANHLFLVALGNENDDAHDGFNCLYLYEIDEAAEVRESGNGAFKLWRG